MPTLFVFLFKVNVALLLFCAGYYLVLRHLTFYSLNRVYLITAILFASIYPLIDLTAFAQQHENIALPVQTVLLNWKAPAVKMVTPLQPNYWQWATILFWAGAVLLTIRLSVQLFSLFKLHRNSKPAHILHHDVRLIMGKAAPFSFWRSIYINPANHSPADLKAILLHEQFHVNGWHTLDILLAELSSIFYWFNPGIWLIKKAVRENIEFITDRKILNNGIDTKAYQYSLVNVSFNATTTGIVNHFNISTIKKRIIMMNAKRSSKFNLTRYAFILPAVALLLVFSLSNAAIVKKSTKAYTELRHTIAVNLKAVMPADAKPKNATAKPLNKPGYTGHITVTLNDNTVSKKTEIILQTDTARKTSLVISTHNPGALDSLNYVLNGKKISNAEFRKIDPNLIVSVNITSADNARLILKDFDSFNFKKDSKILFITTSDAEKGNRLQLLSGIQNQITAIRLNGKTSAITNSITPEQVDSVVIRRTGADGIKLQSIERVYTLNSLKQGAHQADSVIIYKDGSLNGPTLTLANMAPLKKLNDAELKTMSFSTTSPQKLNSVSVKGFGKKTNGVADVRMLSGNLFYTNQPVSRISDKLIVIDGKEATEKELKKLSAYDIDRMSTSSDADTVKKYGSKAKYGVVYIYTKKGK